MGLLAQGGLSTSFATSVISSNAVYIPVIGLAARSVAAANVRVRVGPVHEGGFRMRSIVGCRESWALLYWILRLIKG